MTPDELAAIRARAEAATPGPWSSPGPDTSAEWSVYSDPVGWVVASAEVVEGLPTMPPRSDTGAPMVIDGEQANRNAAFIAAARSDVPALLEEVERLKKAVEAIVAMSDLHRHPVPIRERGRWRVDVVETNIYGEDPIVVGATEAADLAEALILALDLP